MVIRIHTLYVYIYYSMLCFIRLYHIRNGSLFLGQNIYTPQLTKVKFHGKVQVNVHWTFAVKSTGKVTIHRNIPLTSEHMLENTTDQSIGKCH